MIEKNGKQFSKMKHKRTACTPTSTCRPATLVIHSVAYGVKGFGGKV